MNNQLSSILVKFSRIHKSESPRVPALGLSFGLERRIMIDEIKRLMAEWAYTQQKRETKK